MSLLSFISRLLGMSEKTPYQTMREKQKATIEAQQKSAENRAQAHKQNIEFTTQQELNEKIEAENRQTLRRAQEKREEDEARLDAHRRKQADEARRRRELQVNQQYAREAVYDNYDYTRKSSGSSSSNYSSSSSSSDSYSSCSSSSSSSDSSSSCSSSSSSSCD